VPVNAIRKYTQFSPQVDQACAGIWSYEMTDSKNAVMPESHQETSHEVLATQGYKPPGKSGPLEREDEGGSLWSHLGFGLASLLLVAPLFLPGFLESRLFMAYLGIWAALVIGGSLWGVIASLWESIRARRQRRHS
jgi:hypothetical protein